MENKRYQLKVKLKIGLLKIKVSSLTPPKGTCKNCGQLIYWLRTVSKKGKIQISHVKENEYIAHSLVCPTVLAYEERMRRKAMSKKTKNKK